MNDAVCLVSFDTDRVKDYVFATPDLKRIRGGSALLEVLNQADQDTLTRLGLDMETTRTTIRRICPQVEDEKMVTGGGAAMAVVPAEIADQVLADVEKLYREETISGSITGAPLLITMSELERNFGQCVAQVSSLLRLAKDQKGSEPTLPLTAWLHSCDACGRYPAVVSSTDPEGRVELICRSCQIKEEWSDQVRNLFWSAFLQQAGKGWQDTFPKDLGAIGSVSRPPGYVGFIFADGNQMGSMLRQMPTFPAYRHFATELDQLVRYVTYGALLDVLKSPRQGVAPFEILLMGGDDLMLVVAADAALEVACKITEDFEAEANRLAGEIGLSRHLSLSTGVVIAHEKFPLQKMHDLASDLLKRAKRASSQAGDVGTVDFMVVTEAATAGVDATRSQVLTDESFVVSAPSGEAYVLTERPYTVERLRKLLCYASRFKQDFPRASLQAMYESLFQSKVQAQLATLTALVRAKRESRELAWKFFREFEMSESLPWREDKAQPGHFSTALGDLVEIYPFVRRV